MTHHDEAALARRIADIATDYRQADLGPMTASHVEKWASQFNDNNRRTVLAETAHLLSSHYWSFTRTVQALVELLTSTVVFGQDPAGTLRRTSFLRLRQRGRSHQELLGLTDAVLRAKHGYSIDDCTSTKDFLFIDDCVFSGRQLVQDLQSWILQVPRDGTRRTLIIYHLAGYTSGLTFARRTLQPLADSRGIALRPFRVRTYDDLRQPVGSAEMFWPQRQAFSEAAAEYATRMERYRADAHLTAPLLRPPGVPATEGAFSSTAARALLERVFLEVGVWIIAQTANPGAMLRPLGFDPSPSLRFGSLFVTYRNPPNNGPFAYWYGDPAFAGTQHPFGKWYPLFPTAQRGGRS